MKKRYFTWRKSLQVVLCSDIVRNENKSHMYCSCNFLFKQDGLSSSQPTLLTGFVLHSEQIWIRFGNWHRAYCDVWISMSPLTEQNGRVGNITSLWVLYCDAFVHFEHTWCVFPAVSMTSLHIFHGIVLETMKSSSPNTVINVQSCHWRTLEDDHAEQDGPWGLWMVNNESSE